MIVEEKVKLLRNAMISNNIDAFIVYSSDPHGSEYLPEEWLERNWITGFTGSTGFVVFTQEKAALWTDGRYFAQAEIELKDTGIELMKMGEPGIPSYENWLLQNLKEGATVAMDYRTTTHQVWTELTQKLCTKNIQTIHNPLLQEIWKNRTENSSISPIFIHSVEWAGVFAQDKISNIRKEIQAKGANVHLITALDDIAWTLNLRGKDVEYNPVFMGYILIEEQDATLFVDMQKINTEVSEYLAKNGVKIKEYNSFFNFLASISNKKILLSPQANQAIFDILKNQNEIIIAPAPGNLMKAQKNDRELEGFRIAMQKDGVAMVKFLYWLDNHVGKISMNEYSIGLKLKEFRSENENFVGESFGSIVSYTTNGAIIHYSAKPEGSNAVTNKGSLLIDSGGQYLEGTTDITRTVVLGEVTNDFKRNWTLVLKGMIQLSMAKFPRGTKGLHLDAIARLPLWKDGKDYNHGTGHGVGSFLNVHEGPQNIRKDINLQELLPGMVCSNEPGFYVAGEYGIRSENIIAVKTFSENGFMNFETLTVCPFDLRALQTDLLNKEEIDWLNDYHQWCREKLENSLPEEIKPWFLERTKPI